MTRSSLLLTLAGSLVAIRAFAATPGFQEDFAGGTANFQGGSTETRVTTGGVGGASDAYLSISNAVAGQLGSFSTDPNFIGDLTADGVTGFKFWLRDSGANDNHQIHVGVGAAGVNFWLSIPGFTPPDGSWQQFSVDVTDASQWVRIFGTGTFQAAVASSNRLLFRHDLPPFAMTPDPASGDFGLDRIEVAGPVASVPALSAPGLAALVLLLAALAGVALYRRAAAASAAALR